MEAGAGPGFATATGSYPSGHGRGDGTEDGSRVVQTSNQHAFQDEEDEGQMQENTLVAEVMVMMM